MAVAAAIANTATTRPITGTADYPLSPLPNVGRGRQNYANEVVEGKRQVAWRKWRYMSRRTEREGICAHRNCAPAINGREPQPTLVLGVVFV